MSDIKNYDSQLFHLINSGLENPVFDSVMPVFTDLHRYGLWSALGLIMILGVWAYKKKKRAVAPIMILTLSIFLSETVSHRVLKPTFERKRPEFVESTIKLKTHRHSGYSFPSTHASNAFTAATVLTGFYPQLRALYFGIATVLAFSRIYVGVHYPGDVITGAFVGLFIGTLMLFLFNLIRRRSQ